MRRGASRLMTPILQASLKTQAQTLSRESRPIEGGDHPCPPVTTKDSFAERCYGVVTLARTVTGVDSTVLICSGAVAVGASLTGRTSTLTRAAAEYAPSGSRAR